MRSTASKGMVAFSAAIFLASFVLLEFPFTEVPEVKAYYATAFWHSRTEFYLLPMLYLFSTFRYFKTGRQAAILGMVMLVFASGVVTVMGAVSTIPVWDVILWPAWTWLACYFLVIFLLLGALASA